MLKLQEKISKLSKKQVVHRKKGQSSFEFQTNNGYKPWKYSKHGRKNHLDAWRPPSWNSFLDPRFPLRATRRPRTRKIFRARVCASHPPAHVRVALAFYHLKKPSRFVAVTNKEFSQLIRQAVPEIHEELRWRSSVWKF